MKKHEILKQDLPSLLKDDLIKLFVYYNSDYNKIELKLLIEYTHTTLKYFYHAKMIKESLFNEIEDCIFNLDKE